MRYAVARNRGRDLLRAWRSRLVPGLACRVLLRRALIGTCVAGILTTSAWARGATALELSVEPGVRAMAVYVGGWGGGGAHVPILWPSLGVASSVPLAPEGSLGADFVLRAELGAPLVSPFTWFSPLAPLGFATLDGAIRLSRRWSAFRVFVEGGLGGTLVFSWVNTPGRQPFWAALGALHTAGGTAVDWGPVVLSLRIGGRAGLFLPGSATAYPWWLPGTIELTGGVGTRF
jgi:hypothetical protein